MATLSRFLVFFLPLAITAFADEPARRPKSDDDLKYWLANAARHGYSRAETAEALGMSENDVKAAQERFKSSTAE